MRLNTMDRFLAIVILALATSVANAATWVPHKACAASGSECTVNGTCHACALRKTLCAPDAPAALLPGLDHASCCDDARCTSICGYGGCADDMEEISSEFCKNVTAGCFYTCKQETCCPKTCCTQLNCTQLTTNCRVAQQKHLAPGDSAVSEIQFTNLADGGTSPFPFYTAAEVTAGSCEAVRVWGNCLCSDGVLSPGCDPNDSASWMDLSNSTAMLPANLSQTCVSVGGSSGGDTAAAGGGHSDTGSGGQRLGKGAIAGIIVGSVMGGIVVGAAAAYLGLLGHRAREWTQSRLNSSYEEVDQGEGLMPSHIGFAAVRSKRPRGGGSVLGMIRNVLGRLPGRVGKAHADKQPRLSEEGQTGLAEPALPSDYDMFTLEDLEEGEDLTVPLHAGAQPYSRYNRGGKELELGHVPTGSKSKHATAPSNSTSKPLLNAEPKTPQGQSPFSTTNLQPYESDELPSTPTYSGGKPARFSRD